MDFPADLPLHSKHARRSRDPGMSESMNPSSQGQPAGVLPRIMSGRGGSVFAFALLASLGAARGNSSARTLGWILALLAAAWLAAGLFGRLLDEVADPERFPRSMALRAGFGGAVALFGFSAGMLGPLPWRLVPPALGILLGYPVCRRFVRRPRAILGLALAGAPLGAWIAVAGCPEPPAGWLALGVLAWTAGSALPQPRAEARLDPSLGPHPVPPRPAGIPRGFQALALVAWAAFNLDMEAHLLPWAAWGAVAALLLRRRAVPDDPAPMDNLAGPLLLLGFLLEWFRGLACS